jgi:glycosyltransferase involved in cell wall biosynthesis
MKILIIHDYGTLNGGAEHMSLTLREGLRVRGYDVRLFTSTAQPLPLENIADYTCFGTMAGARKMLQVINPSAILRLHQVMAAFQPDLVHVRMFMTQLSPAILPLFRHLPALLHVVNYDLICPLNTKTLPNGSACQHKAGMACYRAGCMPLIGVTRLLAQRSFWKRWGKVFDIIVANSHWVAERLRVEGIPVAEVIWNGVPVRAPRPPLTSLPMVAFAGRFVAKKGIDVLIKAMAQVVAKIPEAILLLAGDGPERRSVEMLIAEYKLTPQVIMFGHLSRPKLERVFSQVWVQVVPSRWEEPFGLVTAEAMMRGTATVVSNIGGPSEMVQEGITGYTVPPGDVEALAQALICILSNRERAEQMGQEGHKYAVAELSEARVVDRFVALYERLCGCCDRSPSPHY